MKVIYQLIVSGVPKAQPRPRMASSGHAYNPNSADAWKAEVKSAFIPCRRPAITGPIFLRIDFFLPRPKSMKETPCREPHVKKPDIDNLLKSTMDALTEAEIWKDDAAVFNVGMAKYYARNGKTGAQIIVGTF
jgi:crossover junction endodeoxyribonuclease RusA